MIATYTHRVRFAAFAAVVLLSAEAFAQATYFEVVRGSAPHDVATSPAPGGPVYYTGQRNGTLGIVEPGTGKVEEVSLGQLSAPHGVIVGPDGAPWITDSGMNASVRVDPATREVKVWRLPEEAPSANLNTASSIRRGGSGLPASQAGMPAGSRTQ